LNALFYKELEVNILIVRFNLEGLTHDEFVSSTDEAAPHWAAIDGLISKYWIANAETNTYGGVYLFENEESMLNYKASPLCDQLVGTPAFVNFDITNYDLIENPSKVTRAI
jgi:hypothetical protein